MLASLVPSRWRTALAEQADLLTATCACHCYSCHDDAEGEDAIRFVEGLEELTHIDAALDADTNRWTLPVGCRLTVLLFGVSGTGKTSLANLLASKDAFGSEGSGRSQRSAQFESVRRWQSSDGSLSVLDSAGFGSGLFTPDQATQFLADVCVAAPQGVSMLLYVVNFGDISEDCLCLLVFLTKYVFDASCLLNLHIVVTHAPPELLLHPRGGSAWVQDQAERDPGFRQLYTLAGMNPSRFIFVENPPPASRRVREIEEQRRAAARRMYHAFSDHPASLVPDFTVPIMAEVRDTIKEEARGLLEKHIEVARLQGELRRRPYGLPLLDVNEDSPSSAYQAHLWNVQKGGQPYQTLRPYPYPAATQDWDESLKEGSDLQARLAKAERAVLAAQEAVETRSLQVHRAPYYQEQVAVMVQRGYTRFLEELRALASRNGPPAVPQPPTSVAPHSLCQGFASPRKGQDLVAGFPLLAELCTRMAAANVEERAPCLIFDWDDTLCPTTWIRAIPNHGQDVNATDALKIALHAGRIEQALRAARSFGSVAIVTLANRQWLEQTCRLLSTSNLDLLSLLDELQIEVHHAPNRTSPKAAVLSPAEAIRAKKGAMAGVLEKYYGDNIKAKVHVLCFGDQDAEASAIQQLVKEAWATSWQRPICKVIRLPQDPDLQDLGKSLQKILTYLPALVRAESDLDLPLNRLDTMRW